MKFQSLVVCRARRKILKFTDLRFLNLARVQVNFKIYLARARRRIAARMCRSRSNVPADFCDKINDRSRAVQT